MKKKLTIIIVIFIIILALLGVSFFALTKVSDDSTSITFNVKAGENKIEIVNNLKSAGLIRSKYVTYVYVFLNPKLNLQAGTYSLSKSMSTKEIITKINDGKTNEKPAVVHITFIEGKRLVEYLKQIEDNFNISYDDMINTLNDDKFLNSLIKDYDFIDESIKNKDIYYSLEGYLYPDTYEFYQNASFETIIRTMLDNMENKISSLKEEINISKYSFHEILTMASIIEKEAINNDDRKKVSQVIYTRLDKNMALGMDVTAYYGANLSLKEEITNKELNENNPYNTRNASFKGLPVGPICSPSVNSIKAALEPADTNYVYFYADIKTGLVYFAENYEDFLKLKNEFGW